MYRVIVKAYDPMGNEVFPEKECLGKDFEEAAFNAARVLGVVPEQRAPAVGRGRSRRRRKASKATPAPATSESNGGGEA